MLVINFCLAEPFEFSKEKPCEVTTHGVMIDLVDTRYDENAMLWMYPAHDIQENVERCMGSSFIALEGGRLVEACGAFPGQPADAARLEYPIDDEESGEEVEE